MLKASVDNSFDTAVGTYHFYVHPLDLSMVCDDYLSPIGEQF